MSIESLISGCVKDFTNLIESGVKKAGNELIKVFKDGQKMSEIGGKLRSIGQVVLEGAVVVGDLVNSNQKLKNDNTAKLATKFAAMGAKALTDLGRAAEDFGDATTTGKPDTTKLLKDFTALASDGKDIMNFYKECDKAK